MSRSGPRSQRSILTLFCIGSEAVSLYLRCSFLREHGWRVLSATSGHEGIFRFTAEPADVVVLDLDGDGAEGALIAAELKRIRPRVRIIILTFEDQPLVEGALDSADAIISRSDHGSLLQALEATPGASKAESK